MTQSATPAANGAYPCMGTYFVDELEPEQAIQMIGEAGFRHAELSCGHEGVLERAADEDKLLRSIARASADAGVALVQMHGRLFNLCHEDADANIAWAHRSLRRAAALGIPWVVLHCGWARDGWADPAVMAWARQRNVEVFGELVRTAESVGTGIALENVTGPRFGVTAGDLLWLAEELNSDHVGICWDTGHAERSCVPQAAAIRAVGDQLVATHIHDNDGRDDLHWMPTMGCIDWPAVMDALVAIGYAGPFNIEMRAGTSPKLRQTNPTPLVLKRPMLKYIFQVAQTLLNGEIERD